MAAYIGASDVAAEPGPLAAVWGALSATKQTAYLNAATAFVNRIVRQDSLALQTKTVTFRNDAEGDIVILPNKPVTAVSAITVTRAGRTESLDLSAPGTVELSGGQSFRLRGDLMTGGGLFPSFASLPFAEDDTLAVTYTCGYASIPDEVKEAAILYLATAVLGVARNPGGASRVRQGGSESDWGTSTVLLDRNIALATDMLAPFRCEV